MPLIHDLGMRSEGAVAIPVGEIVIAAAVEVAHIRAELLLISAEDGKRLLQGTGFAEGYTERKIAVKMFREIIKKGFPKRP